MKDAQESRYDDLLDRPHHVSPKRRPMPNLDRAAQFAPYAALTGYDEAVQEAGRRTDTRLELDDAEIQAIDFRLRLLSEYPGAPLRVTWFIPDARKEGGHYETSDGFLRKIDPDAEELLLEDGTSIPFGAIAQLSSPLLEQL